VLRLGGAARQQGDQATVDLRLKLGIALGQRLKQMTSAFLRHFGQRPSQTFGRRPDT